MRDLQNDLQIVLANTPVNRPEKCTVCGLKAYGYNYEVISCNACKMFFRRSTLENSQYKCKSDGKCFDVDLTKIVIPPKCRHCRLKKCHAVGMRMRLPGYDRDTALLPGPTSARIISCDEVNASTIQHLLFLNRTRQYVLSQISVEDDPSFCDLVATDQSCLAKLAVSTNVSWDKTVYQIKPWGSLGIRVAVEIIKEMSFYKKLLLSDRVTLLKSVAMKSNSLSVSYDSYAKKSPKVLSPENQDLFPPLVSSLPGCGEVIKELSTRLIRPMADSNIMEIEYLLLNMIVICNPAIVGISPGGQKVLDEEQQMYCRLLLQQCFLTDSRNGPSRLADLLTINQMLDGQLLLGRKLDKILRKDLNIHFFMPKLLLDACNIKAEQLYA